ncbi:MAG: alkaline phosphatase family protein [Rhodobacteraceae bacterium]|nr:alkaline phosphatase family protein [Paracoccaceae bacterium]
MRLFFTFLLAFILSACSAVSPSDVSSAEVSLEASTQDVSEKPIVIMIGIDGLRWDAIDRHPAPALLALAKEGVRAKSMTPVMPSLTFVNFYSLATGLYAEHTGITGNMAYSVEEDTVMGRDMHGESRWWGGEPIWVSAEKQGVHTAAMFWLGSEAEIKGVRPTYWSPYEHNKPNGERVEKVLEWLVMPAETRPRLITLYFSDVDSAGHRYGPETVEEGNAIKEVDGRVADLRGGIEKLGMTDMVNIIVVSDHGMTRIDPEFMIYLDDYIDVDDIFTPTLHSPDGPRSGPFVHIFAKDSNNIDALYNALKGAHKGMKVYKREDIPKNWHLNNADRTGDIFAVADAGGMIFVRSLTSVYRYPAAGMHGYDRFHTDMGATFIAAGPNFKQGVDAESFENVEVYGILARILEITPAETDGDIKRVEYFMKP